jgi:hypothetical protein
MRNKIELDETWFRDLNVGIPILARELKTRIYGTNNKLDAKMEKEKLFKKSFFVSCHWIWVCIIHLHSNSSNAASNYIDLVTYHRSLTYIATRTFIKFGFRVVIWTDYLVLMPNFSFSNSLPLNILHPYGILI